MKRSRVKTYYAKKQTIEKDRERNAITVYAESMRFSGEVWPAGGKIQAEMYGERLSYIQNVKIEGNYSIQADEKGVLHYVFSNNLEVAEGYGMCLYVDKDSTPDYRIISIKPYKPLRLEVEKI